MIHSRTNLVRFYLKSCEGRRGLISVKDYALSECNGMWDYLGKSKEPMLKEVVKEGCMMEKEVKKKYNRRTKERNEINWKKKSLYEKFSKLIVDFADSVSWQWLR